MPRASPLLVAVEESDSTLRLRLTGEFDRAGVGAVEQALAASLTAVAPAAQATTTSSSSTAPPVKTLQPKVKREPCWATCVKRLTLRPGKRVRWTMPHRFRYDHEQALAIYTGQAKRNRLSGFETVGCTFYAHGAGVLLRAEAQGCKTKRRVRYRFSVVSLRAHTTRVRIALQDRLLPTPQPKPVEVEEPEVEEPDDPASDAWGRIEGDRCFGIPPAMPGYNCGADPTVTPEEEAPASEEEAPAPTP